MKCSPVAFSKLLGQCTDLVSLLIKSQQKGSIKINVGNFSFEFSNEVQVPKKYSPSQQKRNDERRASFEKKKFGTFNEKRTSSVDIEIQTREKNSVDSESQTDFIAEATSDDEVGRCLETNEDGMYGPSADMIQLLLIVMR